MSRLRHTKPNLPATLLLGTAVGALLSSPVHADRASPGVTEIGEFGGPPYSEALGVTDTGVVVGDANIDQAYNTHAFRWTPTGGLVDLGTLGGTQSFASNVSRNGLIVVGWANPAGQTDYDHRHAFRWTQAGGMVDLGTFGGTKSEAMGISGDGSVIVGAAALTGDTAAHAFRWTQGGGMIDLGTLGGTNSQAAAYYGNGVSADGNVVVGSAQIIGNSAYHAFRWTQAGGMFDLGTLGGTNSQSYAVSDNGLTVVGRSDVTVTDSHAFRWTQATGMIDLGTFGGTYSYASGVSPDGSIVVGDATTTGDVDYRAFRWTQSTGKQDLNVLLSDAGVNMTGIDLQFAQAISPNGRYIVGEGVFPDSTYEAFIVCYDPGNGCVGLTTASSQQKSTQALADHQRAAMVQGRSTANEVLGMTRPMDTGHYMQAGTVLGSAVGYTAGQYEARGVTVLGGVAYGAQDYKNIKQDNAATIAGAVRYSFNDPFGDKAQALHPYAELGGWVTPKATLTLTRSYANGAGSSSGAGSTDTISWAEYGRLGMIWDVTAHNRLTAYGEYGQQAMRFDAYSEVDSFNNPFPASVDGGVLRMDVARAGGLWTHRIDGLSDKWGKVPVSLTLAGAAARSMHVHAGLNASIAGVGTSSAANKSDTWGEFGARLEAQLTGNVAVNIDLTGTTGGGTLGTTIHGGGGISYRF